MRQPTRRKSNRGQVSETQSIPAPIGGWNARDGISDMDPKYAVSLVNFFPDTANVALRKGASNHVTGAANPVETLASYRPLSGAHSLWGWSGTSLYDVTAAGAIGAAAVTGLTNAKWYTTHFSTIGGNFLIAANGTDSVLRYDGSSWLSVTGVSTPAITGVTTSNLTAPNAFKQRLWFPEISTLAVWYSAVGAFAGAYTKFDLSSIFKKGGYLMAMGTWTRDAGDGIDDLAVFITSQGEVALYQGTDPSSATTWALVGVFQIAAPLTRNCFMKLGGELLVITADGVAPISAALQAGEYDRKVNITDILSGAMAEAANLYGGNAGWSLTHYPNGKMLLLNVPVSTTTQVQYVMNTTTRAWCKFDGWRAYCFEVHNGDLYYGAGTAVVKAWTGTSDLGANIVAEGVQAFNYLRSRTGIKQSKLIRPVIGWDSNPAEFLIGVDADFIVRTPTGSISFATATSATWDSSTWDGAVWGGEVVYNTDWYSAFAVGFALAPHLKVSSSRANVLWASTDLLFERGSVL